MASRVTAPVPHPVRFALALSCGLLAGFIAVREVIQPSALARDFSQVWFAARSVLDGVNPYPLVGPGLEFDWRWPLVYPLTAAVAALPLATLAEPVASVLFAVIGGGLFAWALMQHGYGPLFGFFSLGVREATAATQWSPFLSSAFVLAPVAFFLAAKPTLGAAIFIARPSRWAVIGGVLLLIAAFQLHPTWLRDWLGAVQRYQAIGGPGDRPFRMIVTFPGGVLALLCLLRWRRPEARLVAALACVPITVYAYDSVPLMLVPHSFWQSAILVALSYLQYYLALWLTPATAGHAEAQQMAGTMLALFLYLPATLMVLRRPNEGPVPAWLETRTTRLTRRDSSSPSP